MAEDGRITLTVHSTAFTAFTVKVEPGETVSAFKRLIEDKFSCPPWQQRIIHRGRVLDDRETLSSYGTFDEQDIGAMQHRRHSSCGCGDGYSDRRWQ